MENFNILPKEAFESLASVANNLIDKISSATGYIVAPKGKKRDMEEAVSFYIDTIKSNDSMPDLMKAACISNARKAIREYSNQYDILCIAMDNLNETANPDLLNDDWLIEFWEKAGCVNDNDIKLIFGKILAGTCNNRDTQISKSLIHKLYLMDGRIAKALQKLKQYAVLIEAIDVYGNKLDKEVNVLYFQDHFGWVEKYAQEGMELMELEALGIIVGGSYTITFKDESDESSIIKEIRISYNGDFISIIGDSKSDFEKMKNGRIMVTAGTICLTRDGEYLLRNVESNGYLENYLDNVKKVLVTDGYKIQ